MNVLVIGAHPDDEILGCGAVMAKHKREGDDLKVFLYGRGRLDPQDQKYDLIPIPELVSYITKFVGWADVVYTHSDKDLNSDHRRVNEVSRVAFRPHLSKAKMYAFEVPSSTELGSPFNPNVFVEVDEDMGWNKLRTLREFYKDEMRLFPHPRSEEYILSLMKIRGAQSGYRLAEAFELIRG